MSFDDDFYERFKPRNLEDPSKYPIKKMGQYRNVQFTVIETRVAYKVQMLEKSKIFNSAHNALNWIKTTALNKQNGKR